MVFVSHFKTFPRANIRIRITSTVIRITIIETCIRTIIRITTYDKGIETNNQIYLRKSIKKISKNNIINTKNF